MKYKRLRPKSYPKDIKQYTKVFWGDIHPRDVLEYCLWAWETGRRFHFGKRVPQVPCAACERWECEKGRCPLVDQNGFCCGVTSWSAPDSRDRAISALKEAIQKMDNGQLEGIE